ncbi:MAG TPA: CheR family methyltransferase [Planctomycetota bacterium]|nr:CheR family methyltransferase [Planctomycetota bacterium]
MSVPNLSAILERFRQLIALRLGLNFDESKLTFLDEVLSRRLAALALSPQAYIELLESEAAARREGSALACELTVAETYFFRHLDQFRAFEELALVERAKARSGLRTLRVLSAGCASGEEAYSLAIVASTFLEKHRDWKVELRAVDLNPVMIKRALAGVYSPWSLRETPIEVQNRLFKPVGRDFVLDPSVRSMVAFEQCNLAVDDPRQWQPGYFDVIFCRNVVMYFSPNQALALIARISKALAPGGYLFLGHAETLRALSHDFHLCHSHEAFYYRRKDGSQPSADARSLDALPSIAPPLSTIVDPAESWVETIRKATQRIEVLVDEPAPVFGGIASRPIATRPGPPDLGRAVELLQRERFGEALALIDSLPRATSAEPEVLLLRAVLLTHAGRLAVAEEVCRELLAVDELNAGAHYLAALCREGLGDRRGAWDHDQIAAYLDPGFAMPKLHLGLLARHENNPELARRELSQAMPLLLREDSSRLLLFGGGFSRDALVALCRAELQACGASA